MTAPTQQLPDLTDAQKARCDAIVDDPTRLSGWQETVHMVEDAMQEGIALGQQTARDVQAAALVVAEAGGYAAGKAYQASLGASTARDVQAEAVEWRCFHCDESFTDRGAARAHFGRFESSDPACTIDLAKFREMEATLERWQAQGENDTEYARTIAALALESKHRAALQREEEKGYAKGLADGRTLAAPQASDVQPVGAVPDERAAFEAWAKTEGFSTARRSQHSDEYESGDTDPAWMGWQARAAAPALQGESGATCDLRNAAQALVDRWDTPLWKDVPHTGEFIAALRRTLVPHPAAAQDAAGEQS